MSYHFFNIPAINALQAQAELNYFLAGHAVVTVESQLVQAGFTPRDGVCCYPGH